MAEKVTLKARPRERTGKSEARKLRQEGLVPAVIYGHGEATRLLSVDAHELQRLFSHISVENTIISLKIEGQRAGVRALVREVQTHAYRPDVVHVDFYQVHAGEKLHVDVPIRLVGTAKGVREGGVMEHVLHDLPIRCLPDQIPEAIEVPVDEIEVGGTVHVGDIVLPEGVTAEVDPDRTVCSVVAPAVVAAEPEAPEAPEPAVGGEVQPELIRRRPEEEETPPATEQG